MHKIMIAVLAAAAATALPAAANAAACKDAHGKFIKCPAAPVAAAPVAAASPTHTTVTHAAVTRTTSTVTKPGMFGKPMVTTSSLVKDKNGRCHYAGGPKKGQFAKCA